MRLAALCRFDQGLGTSVFSKLTLIAEWLYVRDVIRPSPKKRNDVVFGPSILVPLVGAGWDFLPPSFTPGTRGKLCKLLQPQFPCVMPPICLLSRAVCQATLIAAWNAVFECSTGSRGRPLAETHTTTLRTFK